MLVPPWTPANALDLALIALMQAIGLVWSWRLIWPRWKILGKTLAVLTLGAGLSLLIGHASVLLMALHLGLGLAVHVWFSRKHGFTWWRVEDPEAYVRLSKEWVGVQEDTT
ncbi:MAG: hypothetical protein H6741_27740 [Alphaproteobacteria bacterium]|nr:hypothetical protein [Alphaproteobacteria bacterium]